MNATDLDEATLPALLAILHRTADRALRTALRDAGLHNVAATDPILALIAPEGARPTELARRAGITKQSLGERISHLERLGYVSRRTDPTDRRARLVVLTPAGARALDVAADARRALDRAWASRLGATRTIFRRALTQLCAGET